MMMMSTESSLSASSGTSNGINGCSSGSGGSRTSRTKMERPAAPVVGQVTHHSIELSWEEALRRAHERLGGTSKAAGEKGKNAVGDERLRVQFEQRDKNGTSWTCVYSGFAKQFTVENLDAWESYVFRVRFSDGKTMTSEWSPEVSVTTSKRPMTGEDIHSAILRQNVTELERILDSKEAPIDAVDKYGFSPLMQAAQKGYTDVIELLIDHGADVNMQNESGKTALMLAAFAGKLEAVKELCYRGADKQLADRGGSTALHWAMDSAQLELADWLLENGADIEATDNNGWTPLLRIAAVGGSKPMATTLLRAGCRVDAVDKDGKTAVMLAVVNGHLPLLEVLLEHNADLSVKNQFGKTAYDMAVSMDKVRLTKAMEAHMDKHGIKYIRR